MLVFLDINWLSNYLLIVNFRDNVFSCSVALLLKIPICPFEFTATFIVSSFKFKVEWGFFDPSANLGQELTGKTLGIFGLGKIGFEMARKAKAAFGMPIIYHNRSKNAQAEKELATQHVDFETLLQQSDVLSVHANLSPSTQGIFNAAAFQKMKPTAIFINTARGGVHNQEGLIQALTQGEIWGAGLDVTSPEPMDANDPLLQMQRVCILPHIGSATYTARFAMARLAVQNAIAALNGEQMPHEVI